MGIKRLPETVGIIITTYHKDRAFDLQNDIVFAWSDVCAHLPDGSKVYLLDCGGHIDPFTLPPNVVYITFGEDPGNCIDYAMASVLNHAAFVLADDDMKPLAGFENWIKANIRPCVDYTHIYGVHGREFTSNDYFSCKVVSARDTLTTRQVGFVGVCVMAGHHAFGFSCHGVHRNLDDLYWQLEARRQYKKIVKPCRNYTNTSCSSGKTAMCSDSNLRAIRQKYYMEHAR